MTRATLLSLLAHPAALSAPDVRALEELAQAFPYCQTAHLLLAKAAHDQDSMLAAQRLRRAATYAADRTRLRQLIELPAAVAVSPPVAVVTVPLPAAVGELPSQPVTPDAGETPGTSQPTALEENNAALEDRPGHIILPAPEPALAAAAESASEAATAEAPAPEAPATANPPLAAEALPVPELPSAAGEPTEIEVAEAAEVPSEEATDVAAEAAIAPPAPVAEPAAPPETTTLAAGVAESPELVVPVASIALAQLPVEAAELELPAQAPPIRPPVAAETARFEFGLAASEAAELTAYRLPELEAPSLVAPPATPRLPLFSGAPDISYVPDEGSRLGFCLVPSAAAGPAAMPGSGLPPAAEFFAPDALLLDFLASLPPAELPKPSSLELINSFLQRAPLASRRRAMPSPAMPDPEAQADLSLPSTRVEPDLVSENLAIILARQGKTERAIAVYERLMAKYPEKTTHFATQIRDLKNSEGMS